MQVLQDVPVFSRAKEDALKLSCRALAFDFGKAEIP